MAPQNKNQHAGPFPLVILVQEVHVNPLAQKNIARTLEHFEKKIKDLGLDEEIVIALEGSPESRRPIDPVGVIQHDVSESYLEAGKIDGADFYAINSNPNAKLFAHLGTVPEGTVPQIFFDKDNGLRLFSKEI